MRINKITSIILLFFFISSLLFLHFITYRTCQTFKVFRDTLDFGTEHVQGCFSQNAIKKNLRHYVKTYANKSSFIYKFAAKYKYQSIRKDNKSDNKIFENFGGLNDSDGEILNFSKDNNNKLVLKKPFIKGLINSGFKPLNKNITKNSDYE